jgi:hypothetical protein
MIAIGAGEGIERNTDNRFSSEKWVCVVDYDTFARCSLHEVTGIGTIG